MRYIRYFFKYKIEMNITIRKIGFYILNFLIESFILLGSIIGYILGGIFLFILLVMGSILIIGTLFVIYLFKFPKIIQLIEKKFF